MKGNVMRSLFLRRGLLAAFIAFALCGTSARAQSLFSSIVTFGDSLSDNGNLYAATGGLYPKSSAYVNGLPTSSTSPYFGGRFSNGPVWVETFANQIGVSQANTFNFAFAGANTDNSNVNNPLLPPGFSFPGIQTQVTNYVASLGAANANSGTLYTLFGGANDYLGGGQTNPFLPVNNLLGEVDQLLAKQAKNIVVFNLPNLGQLPGTRGDAATSAGLTFLSQTHNSLLLSGIQQRRALNPGANIYLIDSFALFTSLTTNPAPDFNVTSGYVSSQGGSPGINPVVVGSGPINKYLFFDEIHPTQTGHNAIAGAVYGAVAPEAGTLALLLPGAVCLVGIVRRRRSATIRMH